MWKIIMELSVSRWREGMQIGLTCECRFDELSPSKMENFKRIFHGPTSDSNSTELNK